MLTSRADAASKHQIELDGVADFIASVRVNNVVFATDITKLRARVVVQLSSFVMRKTVLSANV